MRDKINDLLTYLSLFNETVKVSSSEEYFDKMRIYLMSKYPKIKSHEIFNFVTFIQSVSNGNKLCPELMEMEQKKAMVDRVALARGGK